MSHQDVLHGNNLDLLAAVRDNFAHAIVTDPPYGLGFMGKDWDAALPDPRTWAECLRVLKPGGHLVAFGAPRIYHRLACQIEDAGFELRDCLMWVFGSGFPKSMDVSKAIDNAAGAVRERIPSTGGLHNNNNLNDDGWANIGSAAPTQASNAPATPDAARWQGWGTALKPAYEPILLARKPLVGTVAANVLAYGTGAINVDGCRIETDDGVDRSRPPRAPNTIFGSGRGTNLTTSEHNPSGRWPANLILDEDAGAMLDAQSGGASRFFYCPKASRSEREAGLDHLPARVVDESRDDDAAARDSPRTGAGRSGEPRRNAHPTVKPVDLMRWLVRLVTPPGGMVLDPFSGSGTTLVACALEDVDAMGMELDPEHATVANARIAHAVEQRLADEAARLVASAQMDLFSMEAAS